MCDLVWDARSKWFDLGFQLDVKYIELEVIEKDCSNVNSSFRKMLSTWLKMIDPPPSWEDLLTALEHDSVKCGDLAERIRLRFGIFKQLESATVTKTPSSSQVTESTTEQVVKPKRTSATCTIHSSPCLWYCFNCSSSVCKACLEETHSGHTTSASSKFLTWC